MAEEMEKKAEEEYNANKANIDKAHKEKIEFLKKHRKALRKDFKETRMEREAAMKAQEDYEEKKKALHEKLSKQLMEYFEEHKD